MKPTWIKAAFAASAFYDAILAVALLFFTPTLFRLFGVELPNHLGYLQFPALLLMVFAVMYWKIASDPVAYRELIPYGMGLKASYIVIVFFYWFAGNVPWIWVPLAWIDLVFLALFIAAWLKGKPAAPMMV